MSDPLSRLRDQLAPHPRLTVAVSGGVDSLTLAHVAARHVPVFTVLHAVSPAVPPAATRRVRQIAEAQNWPLKIVDSGEFSDPNYRANPHNRCYFCKSNLYGTMRNLVDGPIAAGTNLDDLGEYRPGLIAADENSVIHPFVAAKITKAELRDIARDLGLDDIAELPAQPCLASRVTTGIAIERADLEFIDRIERHLRRATAQEDVRCRITPNGVLLQTTEALPERLTGEIKDMCLLANRTFAGWQAYARGSAFIVPAT